MRVDAHQHFWRLDRGDYQWLTAREFPAIYRDYMPEDLAPALRAARIERTVLIQAAQSESETEFLLALAARTPYVGGVVGWTDLAAPNAPEAIVRLAADAHLVGMRPMLQDLPEDDWILRKEVQPAIRALLQTHLRFDALIKPRHLPAMRTFVERFPELPLVIDHGAKPDIAAGQRDEWAVHMRAIARDSGAFCKLSGLPGEAPPGWTLDVLRPYVDVLLEAFGPARLMFGSDWPVLNLNGDYATWLRAAEALTADLAASEKEHVFGEVAVAFYGLTR